jgi:hypothetical protein
MSTRRTIDQSAPESDSNGTRISEITIRELSKSLEVASIRCAVLGQFLHGVSQLVHGCTTKKSVPLARKEFATALRMCTDTNGEKTLPVWDVIADYASLKDKLRVDDELREKFVSNCMVKPDSTGHLEQDEMFKYALRNQEQRVLDEKGADWKYTQLYGPGGRESIQASNWSQSAENAKLFQASMVDLLRTIYYTQSHILSQLQKTLVLNAKDRDVPYFESMQSARANVNHIGLKSADEKEIVVASAPLLIGCMFNEECLMMREDARPIQEFMHDLAPSMSLEQVARKFDEGGTPLANALTTAHIFLRELGAKDYPVVDSEDLVSVYMKPEEANESKASDYVI